MSIDLRKSQDNNHNKLTIDVDGEAMTMVFKTGGDIKDPTVTTALAGGGHTTTGLYDEWTCEGVVTLERDLLNWLIKAGQRSRQTLSNSAIHKTFSTQENMTRVTKFKNVMIKNLPSLELSEMGEAVTLNLSFSLNDFDGVELK